MTDICIQLIVTAEISRRENALHQISGVLSGRQNSRKSSVRASSKPSAQREIAREGDRASLIGPASAGRGLLSAGWRDKDVRRGYEAASAIVRLIFSKTEFSTQVYCEPQF